MNNKHLIKAALRSLVLLNRITYRLLEQLEQLLEVNKNK